jgi:GNAT superfamily N-acetyltransferase
MEVLKPPAIRKATNAVTHPVLSVVPRDAVVNPERRWKGIGARYGAHAEHVAAGSHVDTHRAEVLRVHARTVAAAVNDHLHRHPDAQIFVAGPVRDRVALIAALPRPASARRNQR